MNFAVVVFFFSVWIAAEAVKENDCLSLESPIVSHFLDVSANISDYLKINQEEGHRTLRKVLDRYGGSQDAILEMLPSGPLEAVLLQHQIAMHNTLKDMLHRMERLLPTPSHTSKRSKSDNEVYPSNKFRSHDSDSKLSVIRFDSSRAAYSSGDYSPTDSEFRPSDCSEVLVAGYTRSGIYRIYPFSCVCVRPIEVYCDMETDGGGWTVFLSRVNVSKPINFTRNWEEYKNGFGQPGEEYWMGNEALHTMSYHRSYIMRMEATDGEGRSIWGEWNTFKVETEILKYKLSVAAPNAQNTAFDRFAYVNNNYFSTFDIDSDKQASVHCAQRHRGGWWYNACIHNNPTGVHDRKDDKGLMIKPWSKKDKLTRYAKTFELKLRPKVCQRTISVARMNTHECTFPKGN